MVVMEIIMDLCDGFIISIHKKEKYKNEIEAWLDSEEACCAWCKYFPDL
jgi:hypothetical protein